VLRVEVKGTGARRRYEVGERIVISDNGELVGEDGDQSGRLLAPAGRVLTVAEAKALGVAALLDDAAAGKPPPAPVEPEPKTDEAAPRPQRRRGRPRKRD